MVEPRFDVLDLFSEKRHELIPQLLELADLDEQLPVPQLRLDVTDLLTVALRDGLPLLSRDLAVGLRLVDPGEGRRQKIALEHDRPQLSLGALELVLADDLDLHLPGGTPLYDPNPGLIGFPVERKVRHPEPRTRTDKNPECQC